MRPTRTAAQKLACHYWFAPERLPSLFGLAPGGVYPATDVTIGAVRSYRTLSPLPAQIPIRTGIRWRFTFCGTFPGVAPAGSYPAPRFHGARTFLPPSLKIQRAAIWSSGRTEYTTINYRKIEANQLAIYVIKSVTAAVVLLSLLD